MKDEHFPEIMPNVRAEVDLTEEEKLIKALEDRVIEFLREKDLKGYKLKGPLPSGKVRQPFLFSYSAESGKKLLPRVVKITSEHLGKDSPTTQNNREQQGINGNEVDIATKNYTHDDLSPNILEHFVLDGGKTEITIESYITKTNLEQFMNKNGRYFYYETITNRRKNSAGHTVESYHTFPKWKEYSKSKKEAYEIAEQLIDIVRTNNIKRDIILNNINPKNFTIDENLILGMVDTQNSSKIDELKESIYPVHDASTYTHPSLLNAPFTGKAAKPNLGTDRHSAAEIIYELITGQKFFEVKKLYATREEFERGTAVPASLKEGEDRYIKLEVSLPINRVISNGKITKKVYAENLETKLKYLPRELRKTFRKALSYNVNESYTIENFRNDLRLAQYSPIKRFFEKFKNSAKAAAWTVVGVSFLAALSFGTYHLITNDVEINPPTKSEMMRNAEYLNYSETKLPIQQTSAIRNILKGRQVMVNDGLDQLYERLESRDFSRSLANPFLNKNWVEAVHGLDMRLVNAWTLTSYIHQHTENLPNENALTDEYIQTRASLSLTPIEYMNEDTSQMYQGGTGIAYGFYYLKGAMGPHNTVIDDLAEYFSQIGVREAAASTGSSSYFPEVDEKGNIINNGYREAFPEHIRSLIETGYIIYQASDKEGNLDRNKLNKMLNPPKTIYFNSFQDVINFDSEMVWSPIRGDEDK